METGSNSQVVSTRMEDDTDIIPQGLLIPYAICECDKDLCECHIFSINVQEDGNIGWCEAINDRDHTMMNGFINDEASLLPGCHEDFDRIYYDEYGEDAFWKFPRDDSPEIIPEDRITS